MKLLKRIVIAGLATLVVSVALPASANAWSLSCYKTTCDGKDPKVTGCEVGATTDREFTYWGKRIELRYHPWCKAAWARTSGVAYNNFYYGQINRYYCSAAQWYCRSGTQAVWIGDGSQRWTRMLGGSGSWYRACISVSAYGEPQACSSSFYVRN